MLRVFRLKPCFELEVNPVNVMYIDVESEDEIYKRFVTEKTHTDREFHLDHSIGSLYLGNYIVLQERGVDNVPTISDLEIVRSIPGAKLPCTFAACMEDLSQVIDNRNGSPITKLTRATAPSDFIISIRSEYSYGQKLTIDQNEALSCAMAYYYPRPPPITMCTGYGMEMDGFDNTSFHQVRYKGAYFVPQIQEPTSLALLKRSTQRPRPLYSHLWVIRYSDEKNTLGLRNFPGTTNLDIYTLPKPIHSLLLMSNLFESRPDYLRNFSNAASASRIFAKIYTELYPGAYIPHFDALWESSNLPSSSSDSESSHYSDLYISSDSNEES